MKICFLKITLTAFLCLEDNGWLHYYQHGNAQHKLLLAKINWEESYRRLPLSPFFAPFPPQGGSPTLLSVGSHREMYLASEKLQPNPNKTQIQLFPPAAPCTACFHSHSHGIRLHQPHQLHGADPTGNDLTTTKSMKWEHRESYVHFNSQERSYSLN